MTIVPADGYLPSSYRKVSDKSTQTAPYIKKTQYELQLKGDLYPGTSNVTQLTDAQQLANYAPWTGGMLNKPIYNIAMKDGVVTFNFLKSLTGIEALPQETNEVNDKIDKIYTIDGRYVGNDVKTLPKGVYIIGKKKMVISK